MEVMQFLQVTGFTYQQLADLCEVDVCTIGRWVRGATKTPGVVKQFLQLWYETNVYRG